MSNESETERLAMTYAINVPAGCGHCVGIVEHKGMVLVAMQYGVFQLMEAREGNPVQLLPVVGVPRPMK